jgi:hypothetical protein
MNRWEERRTRHSFAALRACALIAASQVTFLACGDSDDPGSSRKASGGTGGATGGVDAGGRSGGSGAGPGGTNGTAGSGAGASGVAGSAGADASDGAAGTSPAGGSAGTPDAGAGTGGTSGDASADVSTDGASSDAGVDSATGGTNGAAGADSSTGGTSGDAGADVSSDGANADAGDAGGVLPDGGNSQDLEPPASGTGFQIVTKEWVVLPGQEVFNCYYASSPVDAVVKVNRFVSKMVSAGQQRFTLYRDNGGTTPEGTLLDRGCTSGFGGRDWLLATSQRDYDFPMPNGVAMTLGPRERIKFDTHYLNSGPQPVTVKIAVNLYFTSGTTQEAQALVSFHLGIRVPANGGTQTVSETCTPGAGARFFSMSTHTHQHATQALLRRQNGSPAEIFVQTDDWQRPDEKRWLVEPFATFAAGEKFVYSCSYRNPLQGVMTVGTAFSSNEQCMAITYFFPASAAGSCAGGL